MKLNMKYITMLLLFLYIPIFSDSSIYTNESPSHILDVKYDPINGYSSTGWVNSMDNNFLINLSVELNTETIQKTLKNRGQKYMYKIWMTSNYKNDKGDIDNVYVKNIIIDILKGGKEYTEAEVSFIVLNSDRTLIYYFDSPYDTETLKLKYESYTK